MMKVRAALSWAQWPFLRQTAAPSDRGEAMAD